jgi:hypothetical protein
MVFSALYKARKESTASRSRAFKFDVTLILPRAVAVAMFPS